MLSAITKPVSIAAEVVTRCRGASAFTLVYGYAVHGAEHSHTVRFPTLKKVLEERRNANGRCTLLLGQYEDGSRIRFTYSENRGPDLIDLPAAVSVYA